MTSFLQLILLKHRSYIFGYICAGILTVVIGLLIYTALYAEIKLGIERSILYLDKILHFFGYMVLSFFVLQTLYHLFRIQRLKSFLTMLYISTLIGALFEVMQYYLTNGARKVEFADFIADVLGALSVFALLLLKSKENNQFAKYPK